MKKFKKALALTLGAAMAVSMAGSLNADALGIFSYDLEIEGYEVIDISNVFDEYWRTDIYGIQRFYWDTETHQSLRALFDPKYNETHLQIENNETNIAKLNEIYSKYESELGFDYFYRSEYDGYLFVHAYHKYDSDGQQTFDVSSMPDKSKLVQKFVDELYETGIVESAEYSRMAMGMSCGDFYDTSAFIAECPPLSADDFEKISQMTSNAEITATAFEEDNVTEFRVDSIADSTEFINIITDIKTFCPESKIQMPEGKAFAVFASSNADYANTINLLDPYICDINGDGKADTADAAQILTSYAENASGILKTAESDSMDVNGDGTVDTQDASYVLAYYAEAAAGIR
ncbi:MAG: dockerin type I domain-containing protein [Ruminococcus sp.]